MRMVTFGTPLLIIDASLVRWVTGALVRDIQQHPASDHLVNLDAVMVVLDDHHGVCEADRRVTISTRADNIVGLVEVGP